MTLTEVIALLGLIGTVVSILNYFNSKVRGSLSVMIGRIVAQDGRVDSKQWLVYTVTNWGNSPFYVAGIGGRMKDGTNFIAAQTDLPYKLEAKQKWNGCIGPSIVDEMTEFDAWDSTGKHFLIKGRKAKKLAEKLSKLIKAQ